MMLRCGNKHQSIFDRVRSTNLHSTMTIIVCKIYRKKTPNFNMKKSQMPMINYRTNDDKYSTIFRIITIPIPHSLTQEI